MSRPWPFASPGEDEPQNLARIVLAELPRYMGSFPAAMKPAALVSFRACVFVLITDLCILRDSNIMGSRTF